jgi:hypothetical protein
MKKAHGSKSGAFSFKPTKQKRPAETLDLLNDLPVLDPAAPEKINALIMQLLKRTFMKCIRFNFYTEVFASMES